jgi:hypothetical protein
MECQRSRFDQSRIFAGQRIQDQICVRRDREKGIIESPTTSG